MFNKFKNNSRVMVNGISKHSGNRYKNKKGKIICRDPYFLDYNIIFDDGTEDWIDEKYIRKLRRRKK